MPRPSWPETSKSVMIDPAVAATLGDRRQNREEERRVQRKASPIVGWRRGVVVYRKGGKGGKRNRRLARQDSLSWRVRRGGDRQRKISRHRMGYFLISKRRGSALVSL